MRDKIIHILNRQFGFAWESKALGGTEDEFLALFSKEKEELAEAVEDMPVSTKKIWGHGMVPNPTIQEWVPKELVLKILKLKYEAKV